MCLPRERSDSGFFDNLQVTHTRGPLTEETHYGAWGNTLQAISSRSAGSLKNDKKYNSIELNEDLGLNIYDAFFRNLDPTISRWWQIDPKIKWDMENWTPYNSNFNNPIRYDDPKGDCPSCVVGFFVGAAVEYTTQVASNLIQGKSLGQSLTQVDGNAIAISAVAGAVTSGVSAFVPKTATAKLVAAGVSTAVDAAESAAKQYNETGSISLSNTVTDVIANKVAGKITENVNINSSGTIKATEKQLDRAEKVAAGDATSSGRAATVNKLENKLSNQKTTNIASQQAAGGVVSNTIQGTVSTMSGNNRQSSPNNLNGSSRSASDNTTVKKYIPITKF
ncbi:MAG: hypothetical protein K2X37_00115 [Chitinophagaceae bacterium]|nr:hypothetical protein [Chitinophagaceae bacterium]